MKQTIINFLKVGIYKNKEQATEIALLKEDLQIIDEHKNTKWRDII